MVLRSANEMNALAVRLDLMVNIAAVKHDVMAVFAGASRS